MRRQRKIEIARTTGLRSLVLFGLLLTTSRFAEAQRSPSNSGDAPVVPRSSAIQGRDANANANLGGAQDSRLLIAHGLEMAIEGSTLQGLALEPGVPTGGPGVLPAGPAGVGTANSPATNSSGLGLTGSPGETVSGRPVTTPATGTGAETLGATGTGPTSLGKIGTTAGTGGTGAAVASTTDGARPGLPASGVGSAPGPMMNGSPAAMLRQQAARSFQASNDLLGQANPAPGNDQNFHQAALIYAATLKSLGTQPNAPAAGPAPTAGLPEGRRVGTPAPATIGATELASIALINHAVKEAIGSLRIKQVVGAMGSSGGPAAQQLLAHARRMDGETRSMVQSVSRGAAGVVGPGGAVQALSQQANQLIMAMQALNPEPAAPGR